MAFDPESVRQFERAGWNRAAAGYEASFATASRQFIEPLLDAAHVEAGTRLLDLCCGPGFTGAAGAARGARVSGLDFSTAMLAEARARFPAIAFDLGDAEAPPYQDASFDAVVSNFGVHHVPMPERALAGAFRVTRGGGRFAFTIWAEHERNLAWKLVFDAVRRFGDPAASTAPPPGGAFGTSEYVIAMREAGFAEVEFRAATGVWRHRDATALLEALRSGTARMAAMIEAQTAAALPAIVAAMEAAAAPWRDDQGIAVPIACVVISGIRP